MNNKIKYESYLWMLHNVEFVRGKVEILTLYEKKPYLLIFERNIIENKPLVKLGKECNFSTSYMKLLKDNLSFLILGLYLNSKRL